MLTIAMLLLVGVAVSGLSSFSLEDYLASNGYDIDVDGLDMDNLDTAQPPADSSSTAAQSVDSVIQGTWRAEVVYGTSADDTLFAKSGDDTVYSDAGDDEIFLQSGDDEMIYIDAVMNDGDDKIYGGAGNDTLASDVGADSIYGSIGADVIISDQNSDDFLGDFLHGGMGSDEIYAGQDDTVTTGMGRDTIYYRSSPDNETRSIHVTDFDSTEDRLVIEYDSHSFTQDPSLETQYDEENGVLTLTLDDYRIATFEAGNRLDISQIQLVAR
jgi:Ca2+-binding RTX toxin-like protein